MWEEKPEETNTTEGTGISRVPLWATAISCRCDERNAAEAEKPTEQQPIGHEAWLLRNSEELLPGAGISIPGMESSVL